MEQPKHKICCLLRTRNVAGVLAILVIATVIGIVYLRYDLPFRNPSPGKAAARLFVLEFLDALNTNDPLLLAEVVRRPADEPNSRDALMQFGGRNLTDFTIEIVKEFPHTYQVWITARAGDGAIIEMYQVVWMGRGALDHGATVHRSSSPSASQLIIKVGPHDFSGTQPKMNAALP